MRHLPKVLRWLAVIVSSISFLLMIVYILAFGNYRLIGESVHCETNSPFDLNYTCQLNNIDDETQYWSFESEIPQEIAFPHMMARITTSHWSDGEFKAVLLKNTTIDVCQYSGGSMSTLFIAVFLPDLIEKSNLNRPCPISGGIYLRNFQFERNMVLPRFLAGKWLIEFEFFITAIEELKFSIKIHIIVKPIGWRLFELNMDSYRILFD